MKVVARPKSKANNTTVQLPLTTPNASTDSERQNSPQEGTSDSNPLPLKNIPTHAGTPWPKAGKMSGNLFELRKDWPIPSTTASKPAIKIEPETQEQVNPSTSAAQKSEKWGWGPNCPICKNIKDWNGDHQKQFQHNVQVHSDSNPTCKVFSVPRPRIINSPKISSTPSHKHLMYLIDTQTN